MVLLDLLKVFDIVDHSILLLKVKPIIYILVGLRVKWEKNMFYILALLLGINYLGVSKRYKLIVFLKGKLKNGCFIIDVLKVVWWD